MILSKFLLNYSHNIKFLLNYSHNNPSFSADYLFLQWTQVLVNCMGMVGWVVNS